MGLLEIEVYSVKIEYKNHLRQQIEQECRAIAPDVVVNILQNLSGHLCVLLIVIMF